MLSRGAVTVAFVLLLAACGADVTGPPEIVEDRATCSHCGMLVSELTRAAAYRATGHETRVFDDIGCLLAALRQETASPITVWLQDADGHGWLAADDAVFVSSPQINTPMHGGVLAYGNGAAAEQAAATYRGRVIRSLPELLTANGDDR
jgi:nitrous oxide reductase accessory protein NosL